MTSNKSGMPQTKPDLLEVVYWLNSLTDPVEQIKFATILGDQARDELLPEIASVRRLATVKARKKLMDQGMSAYEANRLLADQVGQSPQTIMRLISERRQYGG